jgi:predicted nucleic-acid-binding protein
MLAADTNVWARAYLNDDAAQAQKARSALAEARTAGGVFVPLVVLAELSGAGEIITSTKPSAACQAFVA